MPFQGIPKKIRALAVEIASGGTPPRGGGQALHTVRCTQRRSAAVRVLPQGPLRPPPHEDHASNLVGPVRDEKGLLGRRRPFQAVRLFRRKWATRTPSTLQKD